MTEMLKNSYYIKTPIKVWYGNFNLDSPFVNSLEGCPEKVVGDVWIITGELESLDGLSKQITGNLTLYSSIRGRIFTPKDIRAVCDVGGQIYL
jgi:hypothetical protein